MLSDKRPKTQPQQGKPHPNPSTCGEGVLPLTDTTFKESVFFIPDNYGL